MTTTPPHTLGDHSPVPAAERIRTARTVADLIAADPAVDTAAAIPARVPVPTGRLAAGVEVRIAWADGADSEHWIAGPAGPEPAWFDALDALAPATLAAVEAWMDDVDSARLAGPGR